MRRRFGCNQHPLFKSKERRKSDLSVAMLEISAGARLVVWEVCGGHVQSLVFHSGGVRTYGCDFLLYMWVQFDNGVNYCVVDCVSAWRDVVVRYFGYVD